MTSAGQPRPLNAVVQRTVARSTIFALHVHPLSWLPMSYRGVKRVLGETRLELKCLVLFAICLFTLIGGSFWWYGSRTEDLVYDKARSTGRDLVHSVLLQQHWKFLDEKKYLEMTDSLGLNLQT